MLILFALMSIVVVGMVGGGVDYGRWLSARGQTQNAIDSAVLAAGRALQTNAGSAAEAAQAAVNAANAYYGQMKSKIAVLDTVTFVATNSNTAIEARGNAYVMTPFINAATSIGALVGAPSIEKLPLLYVAEAKQAESSIAQGSNSGTNIEVSIMLDTTGSMSGTKLSDMKKAAKDLIDIVVWDDQSNYTSKVALAPFSEVVNVGDYFQAVTNQNPIPASHYVYPPSCYRANGTLKSSCANRSEYLVIDNMAKAKCVTERQGLEEFTDKVPGPDAWITTFNDARAYAYSHRSELLSAGAQNGSDFDNVNDTTTTTCPERVAIVPLTSNKTLLKSTIDSFVAENSTAGAVGTQWAWYLISPNWGTIFSGASQPESYGKLTQVGAQGQPLLRKIAILMTDGVYNTYQGVQYNDNSTPSTNTENKTKDVCTAMKAKGITVYTVGFQLNDASAQAMLANCATDSTHFYNTSNGEALRVAFRDIALKISNLRLSY